MTGTSGTRILVVEDQPRNRKLYGAMLKEQGFDVLEAEDGAQAWASISSEEPDAVLMDVHLSGADGISIARRMKEDERYVAIPVILISADDSVGRRILDEGLPLAGFLVKPFPPAEMIRLVKSALGLGDDRRQAPRKPAKWTVMIESSDGDPVHSDLMDVSERGIGLQRPIGLGTARRPVQVGDSLNIVLRIRDNVALRIGTRVAYIHDSGRLGLEFTVIEPEDKVILRQYVSTPTID